MQFWVSQANSLSLTTPPSFPPSFPPSLTSSISPSLSFSLTPAFTIPVSPSTPFLSPSFPVPVPLSLALPPSPSPSKPLFLSLSAPAATWPTTGRKCCRACLLRRRKFAPARAQRRKGVCACAYSACAPEPSQASQEAMALLSLGVWPGSAAGTAMLPREGKRQRQRKEGKGRDGKGWEGGGKGARAGAGAGD